MPAPKGHPPYPGCEKGGRPPKYTAEAIEAEADALLEWTKHPDNLYFIKFAFERGYDSSRLYEFAENNEKFARVFKQVHDWQKVRVAEGAMKNELNAGFTKFFMSNVCGWSEKTESKLSGDQENPIAYLLELGNGLSKELLNDTEVSEDGE